jgi:uncharacterized protein YbjT (DUF2867 family)
MPLINGLRSIPLAGLLAALLATLLLPSLPLPASGQATAPAGVMPRTVLLLGGAGQLGSEIARRLVDRGDRVFVFTRPGSDRTLVADLPVVFVEGDLMRPDTIAAAFRERRYDVVISAVRVEDGDPRFYEKFLEPLTREMKAAGVSHYLHSGAVGAGRNAEKFQGLGWEKVPGLLDRLKDQGTGEDIIRASGVPFTIIRNTRLWPGGTPATGKAVLTEDDSVISPMTRGDVAALTVGCIGIPACLGKTFHVQDDSLSWPPPRVPVPQAPARE